MCLNVLLFKLSLPPHKLDMLQWLQLLLLGTIICTISQDLFGLEDFINIKVLPMCANCENEPSGAEEYWHW